MESEAAQPRSSAQPRASLLSAVGHRHCPNEDLGTLGEKRSRRVESIHPVELCGADGLPAPGLAWGQLVGQPRKPRGHSGVWGQNWNFESLKELQLWSQRKWSSREGGGREMRR